MLLENIIQLKLNKWFSNVGSCLFILCCEIFYLFPRFSLPNSSTFNDVVKWTQVNKSWIGESGKWIMISKWFKKSCWPPFSRLSLTYFFKWLFSDLFLQIIWELCFGCNSNSFTLRFPRFSYELKEEPRPLLTKAF